jgi:hypothetical protein
VLVDIDLRQTGQERLYTRGDVDALVSALFAELALLVDLEQVQDTRCFVLEKPAPRLAKGGCSYKDGFHLQMPGVVTEPEPELQLALRRAMLPHVERIFSNFKNNAEDIYDEAVIKRNGWLLYGAKKPDEDNAWTLSRVVDVSPCDPLLSKGDLARLLSIRDPGVQDVAPMTAHGDAELDRAEREAASRLAARASAAASQHPESSDMTPGLAHDLEAMVDMMSPERARPYDSWILVGLALHNASGGSEAGLRLWQRFGQKCPEKYYADEHEAKWRGFRTPMVPGESLGLGSLHRWAREDSPDQYAAARWLHDSRDSHSSARAASAVQNQVSFSDKRMPLLQALKQSFPDLLLSEDSFRIVSADENGTTFCDDESGVLGHVDAPKDGYWGRTVKVRDAQGAEERFLGLLHGDVTFSGSFSDVHNNIPTAANRFVFTHPEEDRAVLRSVTPNVPAEITMHRPNKSGSSLSISVPGVRERTISTKGVVYRFATRMCEGVAQQDTVLYVNNMTNTTNVFVNAVSEAEDTSKIDKLREKALAVAKDAALRKLSGHVWRPVPGCPCAYSMAESYKDYLNETLDQENAYHSRTAMQRELIEYLTNYNPQGMRDIVFDRGMMSFSDGLLVTSMDSTDMRFVPYGTDEANHIATQGRVARHHIDLPFAPPSTPTPLFDGVISKQFSPEVAGTLMVLLGRLMFPVGTHDNWQVLPWLVGTAGTGKSVVQDVVSAMFSTSATSSLTSNQEQTFGLDGKYSSHVMIGRDLPRKMSSVLSQEMLQCMVSGERVCVPRKNQIALEVRWTVPLLFASNSLPDYADSNGQIVRRLVPFMFRTPVHEPDPTLLQRILASELPAIVSKTLSVYLDAVRQHGRRNFWSWCPAELRAAQKEVGIATSYVRRFFALQPDDEEALTDGGELVYIRADPDISTSISSIKAAFSAFMRKHFAGVRSTEVINKATLEMMGFTIDEKNVCKACSKHCSVPGRRCCGEYSSDRRTKLKVVVGLSLERAMSDDELA